MDIKRVPIDSVACWDKNPRNVKKPDFGRLVNQIRKLGVYKPLLCFEENGRYSVLGGNMRLRAYREIGLTEVDISIVDAPDEATRIQYNLSDNDRIGMYIEDQLVELVYPHIEEIELSDYKVDILEPFDVETMVKGVGPDTESGKYTATCPDCGKEFPIKGHARKNKED